MQREQLLERLWQESPFYLTREDFDASLKGWTLEPIVQDDRLAVIFVVNGPEFHFHKIAPAYQCTRETLRRFPGELIAKYGYALTKTPIEDRRQLRFNERLGFYRTGEDENFVHLRIDHLRSKPCQLPP
jgi:hypothetical protein